LLFSTETALTEAVAGQPYLEPAQEAKMRLVAINRDKNKVLFFIINVFWIKTA